MNHPNDSLLHRIRSFEVEQAKPWFRRAPAVLEMGAGDGFQSSLMASWGCRVTAIDIAKHPDSAHQFYPVRTYDGEHLPFDPSSFDIVFSSHVLEHVPRPEALIRNAMRVLRPEGLLLHILPTVSWRWWTLLAHYPHMIRSLFRRMKGTSSPTSAESKGPPAARPFLSRLWPAPHGEYPNAISELHFYRLRRWKRLFERAGCQLIAIQPLGLFYTGYSVLPNWSITQRKTISRWAGSSSVLFVMKPA